VFYNKPRVRQFIVLLFFTLQLPIVARAQVNSISSSQTKMPDSATQVINTTTTFFYTAVCPPLSNWQTPNKTPEQIKLNKANNYLFYLLAFATLLVAIFRAVFPKYFQNLFKVFFNTTLKQNQLSDQMYLAKLPSLFFNILFCINAGIFTHVVLAVKYPALKIATISYLPVLIVVFAAVYLTKYAFIKFSGFIAGQKSPARIYIFVIFLINKVLGLALLFFAILLAFTGRNTTSLLLYCSVFTMVLLLLVRYFRAFSLLQYRLKVSTFHFFLFVLCAEVVPLLIMCKTFTIYLGKIG
jgi:hypothetical protein